MPSYQVIKPGFFGGRLYDPHGKRNVLHTEKAFPSKNKKEQVPSWLKAIKAETPAEKKAREEEEARLKEEADKKAASDQKDIQGASFMENGDAGTETL